MLNSKKSARLGFATVVPLKFLTKSGSAPTCGIGSNKNLMLHSYQIKFMIKGHKFTYTALLPDYFKKLLKTKRNLQIFLKIIQKELIIRGN